MGLGRGRVSITFRRFKQPHQRPTCLGRMVTWVEAREVLDTIWNGSMYWVVHGAWEKTKDGAWAWSEKKGTGVRKARTGNREIINRPGAALHHEDKGEGRTPKSPRAHISRS
jgi:hypothetical protein